MHLSNGYLRIKMSQLKRSEWLFNEVTAQTPSRRNAEKEKTPPGKKWSRQNNQKHESLICGSVHFTPFFVAYGELLFTR